MQYTKFEQAIKTWMKNERLYGSKWWLAPHGSILQVQSTPGCHCGRGENWMYTTPSHLASVGHISKAFDVDTEVLSLIAVKRRRWRSRAKLRGWFQLMQWHDNLVGSLSHDDAVRLYNEWEKENKEP